MRDAVKEYKKRRAQRVQDRRGEKRYDSVEAYRERRSRRIEERMDAGIGWVYGIAKEKGIDTTGMSPKEVFEALEEKGIKLNTGEGEKTGGKGKKAEEGNAKKQTKSTEGSNSAAPAIKKSTNDRKKQECDGAGYKGKPGEVKTGKAGNLAPKTDAAKRIDTSDAARETQLFKETGGQKGIEKNSLTGFIDENGNLTPERQKVHDEIVQNVFGKLKPYDGRGTMIMSGGGPASGKSFVSDGAKQKFGEDTVVVVDPDAIKAMLPGYADMAVESDKAAGFYHEESSALAKRIYQYAADNNINVVYDGTGDGSIKSVQKKLALAQKFGYAVEGQYVTVDVDGESGALVRNRARYEHALADWKAGKEIDPPRRPADVHVRKIHAAVSDIALDVAKLYDHWELTDNNVPKGAKRPVIAKCKKGGEIEVVPGMERKVQAWLDKGTRGAKVVNGKIVIPDK